MKAIALAAGLAAGIALNASAQQPAAAPASAPSIPAMTCGAPPELPGSRMMEDQSIRRRFEREIKGWGDCVKAYVAERQASMKSLTDQARAHADVANKTINEYNDTMKKINDMASGK